MPRAIVSRGPTLCGLGWHFGLRKKGNFKNSPRALWQAERACPGHQSVAAGQGDSTCNCCGFCDDLFRRLICLQTFPFSFFDVFSNHLRHLIPTPTSSFLRTHHFRHVSRPALLYFDRAQIVVQLLLYQRNGRTFIQERQHRNLFSRSATVPERFWTRSRSVSGCVYSDRPCVEHRYCSGLTLPIFLESSLVTFLVLDSIHESELCLDR